MDGDEDGEDGMLSSFASYVMPLDIPIEFIILRKLKTELLFLSSSTLQLEQEGAVVVVEVEGEVNKSKEITSAVCESSSRRPPTNKNPRAVGNAQ
jgi:hypothetical protein